MMDATSPAGSRSAQPGATAAAKAYNEIRAMIMSGQVQPGQRLKEEELTELCGVSRTPVREALRRLSVEGLLVVTPRHSAEVVTVDVAELEEIYALRAMVESHAAARAATRLDDRRIDRLKVLAAQMSAAAAKGRAAMEACFPAANAEFHAIILEGAQSPRLTKMAALVVQLPLTLRALANYSDEDRARSLLQHGELISAFEARSAEWAGAVMYSHIYAAFFAASRAPAGRDQPATPPPTASSRGGKTPARPSKAGKGAPSSLPPNHPAAAIRRSRS